MTREEVDNAVSFITGDLVVMIVTWIHFDIAVFAVKIAMVMVVGFLGGAAGLAGKDFYQWFKKRIDKFS